MSQSWPPPQAPLGTCLGPGQQLPSAGWALASLAAPAGEKGQPTVRLSASSKEFSVQQELSKEI